jgi:hypothetical protein
LVYSSYSTLVDGAGSKMGIVFFNKSLFARGRLLPKLPVTAARTLEDKLILSRNHVRVRYLFLPDSTLRDDRPARLPARPSPTAPGRIFAPLGVGGHVDHLLVRKAAIAWWLGYGRTPQICFFEDLPYAARSTNLEEEEAKIAGGLSALCGPLAPTFRRLAPCLLRRKLLFSRLYLTQTDKTELLVRHAAAVGRLAGVEYAERYYCGAGA